MKVFMRDEYRTSGDLIADVDPREVEEVFNCIRRQGVYDEDESDHYGDFSWQVVHGEAGSYAEIILHPATDSDDA